MLAAKYWPIFGKQGGALKCLELVENLLCFAAAFILDLALVQLLRPTAPQTFALALTAGVYIGAFVFGAGMVLLVTWATMRNLKRRKLVELMERVS